MPTLSVSRLADITGKDRRTIAKRIEGLERLDNSGYDSRKALPLIYAAEPVNTGGTDENGKPLDPMQEQAQLNKSRRQKVDLETQLLADQLCYTDEVRKLWIDCITGAKVKLLALPHRAAHQVIAANDYKEAEEILKNIVYEALNELSSAGYERDQENIISGGTGGLEAPA